MLKIISVPYIKVKSSKFFSFDSSLFLAVFIKSGIMSYESYVQHHQSFYNFHCHYYGVYIFISLIYCIRFHCQSLPSMPTQLSWINLLKITALFIVLPFSKVSGDSSLPVDRDLNFFPQHFTQSSPVTKLNFSLLFRLLSHASPHTGKPD